MAHSQNIDRFVPKPTKAKQAQSRILDAWRMDTVFAHDNLPALLLRAGKPVTEDGRSAQQAMAIVPDSNLGPRRLCWSAPGRNGA